MALLTPAPARGRHVAAGATAARSPRARRVLRLAGLLVRVVSGVVLLASSAALLAAVAVPRLTGATPYAVLTGSMEPGLPPGTLVVVRPVAVDDLEIGDVVTYQLTSGDPTVVTHRVVGVGYDGEGRPRLVTQGDANDVPDAAPVRAEQVRGELWYSVPELGRLHVWLTGRTHEQLVHLAAAGLALYALRSFALAARTRRRRRVVP